VAELTNTAAATGACRRLSGITPSNPLRRCFLAAGLDADRATSRTSTSLRMWTDTMVG
jgi:hypothetical protein